MKRVKVLEELVLGDATFEVGAEIELTDEQIAEAGSKVEVLAAPASETGAEAAA